MCSISKAALRRAMPTLGDPALVNKAVEETASMCCALCSRIEPLGGGTRGESQVRVRSTRVLARAPHRSAHVKKVAEALGSRLHGLLIPQHAIVRLHQRRQLRPQRHKHLLLLLRILRGPAAMHGAAGGVSRRDAAGCCTRSVMGATTKAMAYAHRVRHNQRHSSATGRGGSALLLLAPPPGW